jgi:hypothetical protein
MQQARDLRGPVRNKSAQHDNQGNGVNSRRKAFCQQDEHSVYIPPTFAAGILSARNYQSYQRI